MAEAHDVCLNLPLLKVAIPTKRQFLCHFPSFQIKFFLLSPAENVEINMQKMCVRWFSTHLILQVSQLGLNYRRENIRLPHCRLDHANLPLTRDAFVHDVMHFATSTDHLHGKCVHYQNIPTAASFATLHTPFQRPYHIIQQPCKQQINEVKR